MTKKILTVLLGLILGAAATQAQSDSPHKNLSLDIAGMTCSGCAAGAANAVKQLNGITKAEINFAQKTGAFVYDSSKVTESKIIQAINDAGFKASVMQATASATLDVSGMTCQMCANSVETALTEIDGVKDANVSLNANQAAVTYDSNKVNFDTLISTIGKAGGTRHTFKAEKAAQPACDLTADCAGNSDGCCATQQNKIQK